MKTIHYFFFIALGGILMAADCSNKDNEFYNDVYLTANDLIEIETQSSEYSVGDVLWINSDNFSRYLSEPGQSTPLDVYKTTGGAKSFNFTYVLEKKIEDSEEWAVVPLGSNLIKDEGSAEETDSFVAALCIYTPDANPALDRYEFRNGISLTEPGEYRLSFGYNSISANSVEMRSDSVNNNLFLNINSIFTSGLDSGGYYYFSVGVAIN